MWNNLMKKWIMLIGLLLGLSLSGQSDAGDAAIVITFTGMRTDTGSLRVSLFKQADGFPRTPEKALLKKDIDAEQPVTKVVLGPLKKGTYAIAVMHDENDNKKMDTNWIGMPKEGFGASNDASGFMGPPSFEDASFELKGDTLNLSITVKYL
jgi:uncharacterized protein (DUF2141 family)